MLYRFNYIMFVLKYQFVFVAREGVVVHRPKLRDGGSAIMLCLYVMVSLWGGEGVNAISALGL